MGWWAVRPGWNLLSLSSPSRPIRAGPRPPPMPAGTAPTNARWIFSHPPGSLSLPGSHFPGPLQAFSPHHVRAGGCQAALPCLRGTHGGHYTAAQGCETEHFRKRAGRPPGGEGLCTGPQRATRWEQASQGGKGFQLARTVLVRAWRMLEAAEEAGERGARTEEAGRVPGPESLRCQAENRGPTPLQGDSYPPCPGGSPSLNQA